MRPRASTFSIAYDKLSVGEPDSPVIALAYRIWEKSSFAYGMIVIFMDLNEFLVR